jgi:UDP-2,3-diacylglucosamine pyrophosphatase LpxH
MQKEHNPIAEMLLNCEENGTAPKYIVQTDSYKEQSTRLFQQALPVRTKPVIYKSVGEEIFVVSDLHIASGRNYAGVYRGTENFFADDSFYRFLQYAQTTKKTDKALLIINGDIFDFLRITDCPGKVRKIRLSKKIKQLLKLKFLEKPQAPSREKINEEYEEWMEELKKVGIKKTTEELEDSISKKEREYGLRTDNFKTIYKLIRIRQGHPAFFKALSRWLEQGNRLVVLKGNHDLELYWLAVRNYLRLIIAEGIGNSGMNKDIENVLKGIVLPNITFIDDSIEIDKDFYVEHGHRYDKFCMVLENPELGNSGQINIPFGSFFNRYLLNRVELFYPYLDNVRPSGNVLPMLMKENFPLGLKVLLHHIPLLIRILFTNFRYLRFMLGKVFLFVIALLIPAALIVYFNFSIVQLLTTDITKIEEGRGIGAAALEQAKSLVLLFLSYLLSRIVAWFQLAEPSSLDKFARIRFEGSDYRIMTMGHTHNPGEYVFMHNRRFYNTGTWIPVIETSTADVREDKTYTFLHLVRDKSGKLQPDEGGLLQRWNDDAGRAEPQVLVMRK